MTVHGTNDVRVENNVTYNIVGHCFFLEDGIEHGNQFVHNLAIQIKCHTTKPCVPTNLAANGEIDYTYENRMAYRKASLSGKDTLLPSDNTVAAYWITNPDNTFIDNVAAGSDENGFWLSLPEHPQRRVRRLGYQPRPPGRVEPDCANSGATLPIPTSTGSCSTGTSMWTTPSG